MEVFFIIANITKKDVTSNLLRIIKENKKYLPGANNVEPKSYELKFEIGSEIHEVKYRVGEKRSGMLRIGTDVYKNKLCIKPGDRLRVTVLEMNRLYKIEKANN